MLRMSYVAGSTFIIQCYSIRLDYPFLFLTGKKRTKQTLEYQALVYWPNRGLSNFCLRSLSMKCFWGAGGGGEGRVEKTERKGDRKPDTKASGVEPRYNIPLYDEVLHVTKSKRGKNI